MSAALDNLGLVTSSQGIPNGGGDLGTYCAGAS
jgi:hypothetical protein